MSGKYYAYLFTVKSIQSYLFSSGKLKDMVAASDELDGITGDLLEDVLIQLGLSDAFTAGDPDSLGEDQFVYFSRRAGGAAYAIFKSPKTRQRFQALWSFTIRNIFPDVECLQAVPESGSDMPYDALKLALDVLNEKRNLQVPQLPAASPITMRAQRTGKAAVDVKDKEAVDEVTELQRKSAGKRAKNKKGSTLTRKFLDDESFKWPVNFESTGELQFPFKNPEERDIALIHADGNGIGQVLMSLRNSADELDPGQPFLPLKLFRDFSIMMEEVTRTAAQKASNDVLEPAMLRSQYRDVVPARPLVLGGDDITLLCRNDLALPFFKVFTAEFRRISVQKLDEIRDENPGLPACLTASGGIALIKANQPFMQCHELVESLCSAAKRQGRKNLGDGEIPPSMVSFHRVAATMINTVDAIREHEWTVSDNRYLSLEAYCLEESSELPQLGDLLAMHDLFSGESEKEKLTMNRLREVAALVKESQPQAIRVYRRWHEVAEKNEHRQPKVKQFAEYLEKLTHGEREQDLPFAKVRSENETEKWISPLADLLTIQYFVANNEDADKEASHG